MATVIGTNKLWIKYKPRFINARSTAFSTVYYLLPIKVKACLIILMYTGTHRSDSAISNLIIVNYTKCKCTISH